MTLADPIFTPLLISALGYVGVTGTVATVAAGIASAILVTGIGIGLQLLFAPKPAKPQDGSVPTQQTIPPRIWGYGTDRVAGSVMLKESANGNLYYVAALNGHRISAFHILYLNDDVATIIESRGSDPNYPVELTEEGVSPTFRAGLVAKGPDGRYDQQIQIDTRLGFDHETAYAQAVSGASPSWTSACRGDGIASLMMICAGVKSTKFQTTYPSGVPQPSVVIDQAPLYDPRDASQNVNDQTTWKFTDNPALAMLHFRCFSPYGSMVSYETAILPNVARWIEAANVCDETTPTASGVMERRYRIAGWMTTEQDRRTGENAIRSCFDGWTVDRGDGSIDIEAGRYYPPTVIITDDDIIAWSSQRGISSKDAINRFTARYKDPTNAYAIVSTAPINNLEDQALRPGPAKAVEVDLTWSPSPGQASRLLYRERYRQEQKTRGTLTCGLSALNACYERRILIQSNSIPRLANIVVEISKPTIDLMSGTVTFDFIGSGPEIDNYDTSIETLPATVPTRPMSTGLPVPANVSAIPESIGSSIFLNVSWDSTPQDAALNFAVQYRTVIGGSAGSWVPQEYDDPLISGNRVSVLMPGVPSGTLVDVQVASIGSAGTSSDGSTIVQVDTSNAAPGQPLNLNTTNGIGTVTLDCDNPNSSNLSSIAFYRAALNGTFASAVKIATKSASANGTTEFADVVAPGSYSYYATASSAAGYSSAPAGPVNGISS